VSGVVAVLADPERVLLEEIADDRLKREDIAASYALAMKTPDKVDWPKVNRAIIDRWSKSGLVFIKERAWKVVRG
jgi:hypothetical protein